MDTRKDAIYARQSVDKVDSISIESQLEMCRYETRGEEHLEFADKGYSGKNTDRPKFQELMQAVRENKVKRVICYRLDRASRSILDFANMMNELQKHNAEFVSCTEKFDTSTPMGRAMLNICIVFAQLERETIQQRVVDTYISRSRKGFYMGGRVPYGYVLEPYTIAGKKTSRYRIVEEEADVLRLIYSLYDHPNTSFSDIINYLVAHNIKNSRAPHGQWDKSRISDMLRNPVYVKADLSVYRFFQSQGTVLYNDPGDYIGTNGCYLYAEKDAKRRKTSLEGHHIVIAPHEGIVEPDIWLRVRKKLLGNKQVARPIKAANTWLAGKIKCGRCGYALVVRKAQTKAGRYFICSHRAQTQIGCAGVHGIYAREIEDIVFCEIREKLKKFAVLEESTTIYENPKLAEYDAEIERAQRDIDSLMDKLADADPEFAKFIKHKVLELSEKISELQKERSAFEANDGPSKRDARRITNYIEKWDALTIDDKMAVVDALIISVHVKEGEIRIEWKI